jgi:hypothetical protein
MPKIRIAIQAVGNQSTRETLSGIVRSHLRPLKPKMRYYGHNGPVIWVRATIDSDDLKSIDAFQEKYGNDILSEIRKHNIKDNPNCNALYMVHLTDHQAFQETV